MKLMKKMSHEMAEMVCSAIKRKKSPQALFSDPNPSGFRIKAADKVHGNELFLDSFLMVADKTTTAQDIKAEWDSKLFGVELAQ
jgi:hypothetical protein